MMAIREGNSIRDIASHHGARIDRPHEPESGIYETPVLQTIASTGQGVSELSSSLDEHFDWLSETGELQTRRAERRIRRTRDVLLRLAQRDAQRIWRRRSEDMAGRLGSNELSPYSAARSLYDEWMAERS